MTYREKACRQVHCRHNPQGILGVHGPLGFAAPPFISPVRFIKESDLHIVIILYPLGVLERHG